jgi:hypothetical protein
VSVDVSGAPPLLGPVPLTPPRRPGSVRRTATIDATWPEGWDGSMQLTGRARDLATPADGSAPVVLAEGELVVRAGADRTVEAIESRPSRPELAALVGARGGGRLRRMLAEVLPDERSAGTPLYLLLDDLSGATLISRFAWSQWPTRWPRSPGEQPIGTSGRRVEGICTGFQTGASALTPDGRSRFIHDVRPVSSLLGADPFGWHDVDEPPGVSMRRARRIDVTVGDVIAVDAMFQDSSTVEGGGRIAVHEYALTATVDPVSGVLTSVRAEPHVLPFRECPLAVLTVDRLIGLPVAGFRTGVPETLGGTAGCTHLNDALRALAEVPVLASALTRTGHDPGAGETS